VTLDFTRRFDTPPSLISCAFSGAPVPRRTPQSGNATIKTPVNQHRRCAANVSTASHPQLDEVGSPFLRPPPRGPAKRLTPSERDRNECAARPLATARNSASGRTGIYFSNARKFGENARRWLLALNWFWRAASTLASRDHRSENWVGGRAHAGQASLRQGFVCSHPQIARPATSCCSETFDR